ncbi:hypothetical protein, partial [Bacteroides xylanisolvens]|uniref:hypothetical protein n=1 Tax=Bacteroides xylanisolvens TaxID=371601 RepID=UPI0023080EF8
CFCHITKVITLKKATNSYPQEISGEPKMVQILRKFSSRIISRYPINVPTYKEKEEMQLNYISSFSL